MNTSEGCLIDILSVVRLYPPAGGSGAEWYLHELLVALVKRGHTCRVYASDPPGADTLDGVDLTGQPDSPADVILTQIDGTPLGKRLAKQRHLPLVHFAHSDRQFGHQPTLQVANSGHVALAGERYGPVLLCRPHVPLKRYQAKVKAAKAITLVNLSAAKGARLFYALAACLSDHEFIGVTGAWDTQLTPPSLPNLRVVANTPDMRKVYQQTRILLMPSQTESWGRCAVEAAVNGIPTISTLTAGVLEALAGAAVYATSVDEFTDAIRCLDQPDEYLYHSDLAKRRAAELETITLEDLDRCCAAIEGLVA